MGNSSHIVMHQRISPQTTKSRSARKRSSSSSHSGGSRSLPSPSAPRPQPLLVELPRNKGKVQGLDWVEKNLIKDEDGDEAHEFLGPF